MSNTHNGTITLKSLADLGSVLDPRTLPDIAAVVWCTGFRPDFAWVDLPVFGGDGQPIHDRGIVTPEPGLYFMGLPFQYAVTSDVLPGAGRDAAHIARHIVARRRSARPDDVPVPA